MTDNERNRFTDNFAYLRLGQDKADSIAEAELALLADLLKAETPQKVAEAFASITGYGYASAEFARLCTRYVDKPDMTVILPNDDGEREEYAPTNAVAYMKNRLSDEAITVLAMQKNGVKLSDSTSFAEVAEKVSYGKADYAVLPFSTSADGPVLSVRKLIRRYDLKLTEVADIADDDNVIRFAKVSRDLPMIHRRASYIELTSQIGDATVLSALMPAFTVLEAKATAITLEQSEYGGMTLTLTLDTEKSDIFALLMFLKYALPHYTLTGIYNIKENTHGLHG